ncbi:MAG: hypothetical protein ABI237_18805 [Ginsengibacter sp.]
MDTKTPPGKARFLYFLTGIQTTLQKAAFSENPSLFIYKENMRTPLFMLEALARLYKKIHNHHKLSQLDNLFKDMEDRLGAIDYYDGFHKEFVSRKRIPDMVTRYLQKRMNKKVNELNHELEDKKWLGKHQKGIDKIVKKLDDINWLEEKEDTARILSVYRDEMDTIQKKYKMSRLEFKDIEADVHELRRELRWLSIYPQALRGLMQLKVNNDPPDFLKKYLTTEIVNSSYNVMPDGSRLQNHILLNNHYFYGLSWMIAELGKLKDNGLGIEVLKESLTAVYKISEDTESLAYSISNENQLKTSEILAQSQTIARTFFDEKILEGIITH